MTERVRPENPVHKGERRCKSPGLLLPGGSSLTGKILDFAPNSYFQISSIPVSCEKIFPAFCSHIIKLRSSLPFFFPLEDFSNFSIFLFLKVFLNHDQDNQTDGDPLVFLP